MAARITAEDSLLAIEESFDKPAWFGPNLRGSLRRVDAARAAWRRDLALLGETHARLLIRLSDAETD